jgi:tetratricopeptide (TPR) repeat protein
LYFLQKQPDDAIAALEQAVGLDENFVCGRMLLVEGLSLVGHVGEAVQVGGQALGLKALPPDHRCLYGVASAYGRAGRLEETALSQRLLRQFPNFLVSQLQLTAIYRHLSREVEARAAAAEVLRLHPHFTLEVYK